MCSPLRPSARALGPRRSLVSQLISLAWHLAAPLVANGLKSVAFSVFGQFLAVLQRSAALVLAGSGVLPQVPFRTLIAVLAFACPTKDRRRFPAQMISRLLLYKYLGIFVGAAGGWQHHVQHMIENKTREIVCWARLHDPLPLHRHRH